MASKLQVTPAECRRRAAECHKMAENAPSPHVRDTLADIERMWNRLAVETEVSQAMVSRFLGGAAFGPDEIAIMARAYEAGLKQINVSGQNDVAAESLAQTIVRLAKHGERDPIRLGQRAVEIMSGTLPDVAGSTQRKLRWSHCVAPLIQPLRHATLFLRLHQWTAYRVVAVHRPSVLVLFAPVIGRSIVIVQFSLSVAIRPVPVSA